MVSKTPASNTVVIENTSEATNRVCERILSELEAHDFGQDNVFAVHLALEEVLTNALKHGNKMDPSKEIKIDYLVSSEKIEVCITDEGVGFIPGTVPDPRSGENLYKVNGRGLFLIRAYMDVVEYNDRGNSVHMIRYKQKPTLDKK